MIRLKWGKRKHVLEKAKVIYKGPGWEKRMALRGAERILVATMWRTRGAA